VNRELQEVEKDRKFRRKLKRRIIKITPEEKNIEEKN